MKTLSKISPLARAVGVMGATAAVVTGVTFAALNSQATLTGNTLSTATADLKIWNGSAFAGTATGFTVTGLVPGTGVEYPFYLQNNGGVALDVAATATGATTLTGFTGLNNVKVTFTSDNSACVGSNTVSTDLAALTSGTPVALPCNALSAGATGNSGVAGTEGNYKVKFDIAPSAITGSSASVSSFDVQFTGTQHGV